ncbi:Uncharacterized protein At4g02000 [Linum perenne]
MAGVWRPGRKMEIEDIGNKLILFRFNHSIDLRRVVDSGPWTFDQSLLILRELKEGETPESVELCYADFWIQVRDLPAGLYSMTVGRALGDYIGKFLEYDPNSLYGGPDSYMRIRVRVDVRQSLKREKRVRKAGGETTVCKFQYERLPDFCYICGKMGHTDRFCEVLFRVPENQIVRLWDKTLRAPTRRDKQREGDRWLVRREDKAVGRSWSGGSGVGRGGGEVGTESGSRRGVPRGVAELWGNLGASEEGKDIPIAYEGKVVADEADVMEVMEEQRKRRREGGVGGAMGGGVSEGGKPGKSPKKDGRDPKNVSQVGRASSTCQSS